MSRIGAPKVLLGRATTPPWRTRAKPKPPSAYAKRMERMSNRIFGEVWRPTDGKSMKIVRQFSALPKEQDERYTIKYYPPHPMFHYLAKMLRQQGLYRDEHLDFNEEMDRQRALRGKFKVTHFNYPDE